MTRKTIPVALLAVFPLAACELAQGQPDHIVVTELEAPWVDVTPPTELWIELIPEGDFEARCTYNFGGTPHNDSRGLICEVGPDQDVPS